MGTSAAVRSGQDTILEGPYIANGAIGPFSIMAEPAADGTIAVATSNDGCPSANSETLDDGYDQVFIVRSGRGTVRAGGSLSIGDSVVATTAGAAVDASGAVSRCVVVNDGTGLAGYSSGDFVPVIVGNPAKTS